MLKIWGFILLFYLFYCFISLYIVVKLKSAAIIFYTGAKIWCINALLLTNGDKIMVSVALNAGNFGCILSSSEFLFKINFYNKK